ncbi:UDP-glucose 4-epimerase [Anoplolepis gracilipes]|uniref:UDP-glucose 4-epimerase n=1 Tax=Anoplolepis gracilipes TaxID=354296 RepID=UPI003B9F0146
MLQVANSQGSLLLISFATTRATRDVKGRGTFYIRIMERTTGMEWSWKEGHTVCVPVWHHGDGGGDVSRVPRYIKVLCSFHDCYSRQSLSVIARKCLRSPSDRNRLRFIKLFNLKFYTEKKKMSRDWKTIFVTGGAGYIGSHCIVELLECGYDVVAIDNFANSVTETDGESAALKKVEQITGKKVIFYNCDLLDREKLETIFNKHKIDCVIHFAAIKAVGESMQVPLHYYRNNIIGAINLLEVMKAADCFQLVFSSSCTVYGEPTELPITEEHKTGNITNVYGRTKYFIEEMLKDISRAEKSWNIISLRYFNPVGAHHSGLIGEDPTKPFTNLMPYIAQVASRQKPELIIFGGDYPTNDGTGVRDYIHVMDLAAGHVAALNALHKQHLRLKIYNLGTGNGVTVLELIKTFEKVTGTTVPYIIKERREGDIVSMYANTDLAKKELGWTAKYNVEQMCQDFWRWQAMNPHGYRTSIKNCINEHLNNTNNTS